LIVRDEKFLPMKGEKEKPSDVSQRTSLGAKIPEFSGRIGKERGGLGLRKKSFFMARAESGGKETVQEKSREKTCAGALKKTSWDRGDEPLLGKENT